MSSDLMKLAITVPSSIFKVGELLFAGRRNIGVSSLLTPPVKLSPPFPLIVIFRRVSSAEP